MYDGRYNLSFVRLSSYFSLGHSQNSQELVTSLGHEISDLVMDFTGDLVIASSFTWIQTVERPYFNYCI